MRIPLSLWMFLLLPALQAQQPADWRMPFRRPLANVEPPEAVFRELRIMQRTAGRASAAELRYEDGVEVCDDPAWQKARNRLQQQHLDAGYLSAIIRESASVADRATAFYGSFFVPDPDLVMQMIAHIPGEPVRSLREDAYRRAVAFLRIHLPKVNEGDLEAWRRIEVGPAGRRPPRPGDFRHELDLAPFLALLEVDDPRDHQQALWFLRQCVAIRPALAGQLLELTRKPLRRLLCSEAAGVATAAAELVQEIDPAHRPPPGGDAPDEERIAWLDAVVHDLLPPIRHLSSALTELYPSDDLDRVVAVGRKHLADGSLGDPQGGKLRDGSYYRGFRIARTPPPLDQLGLAVGWIVTAVNGVPVATGADVLATLTAASRRQRTLLVEYVDGEVLHAKEFRLR